MIGEQEAIDALPKHGFVHDFCLYGHQVCDGPVVFMLNTALPIVSAVADPDLCLPYGDGQVAANYWSLLVGPSSSRKTTIARIGLDLLQDVDPMKIGEAYESQAALLKAMYERPQLLIPHTEFGSYLSSTTEGSYKDALRTQYMELWDGTPVAKVTVRDTLSIPQPRLSLLCCVAPGLLEQYTTENDFTGGFFPRFVIVHSRRFRSYPMPSPWPEGRKHLRQRLQFLGALPVGRCKGLAPEALRVFLSWNDGIEQQVIHSSNRWTEGAYGRIQTTALKAALLYSLDIGAAGQSRGRPWELGPEELHYGIKLAELHAKSTLAVVQRLAIGRFGQNCRNVLDAVGDGMVTDGQLFARCNPKLSSKEVKEVIDVLQAEGKLHQFAPMGVPPMWTKTSPSVSQVDEKSGDNVLPFRGPVQTPADVEVDAVADSVPFPDSDD